MERPLLLVDVDGVISLFGFDPAKPPPGRFELVDGIAHFLSAHAGEHLRELARSFELVWCTGWEEKANEYLPAALGLPESLPHLTFAPPPESPTSHWKVAAIEAFAGSVRAVAWIDDAHDERCTEWATTREGPTLLVATEPAVGLTDAHVAELLEWARGAEASAGQCPESSNDPCRPAPARKRSSPA